MPTRFFAQIEEHATVLILNAAEVRRSLPMPQAIEAMQQAFAAYSSGHAVVPPRTHLAVPQHSGVSLNHAGTRE